MEGDFLFDVFLIRILVGWFKVYCFVLLLLLNIFVSLFGDIGVGVIVEVFVFRDVVFLSLLVLYEWMLDLFWLDFGLSI